MMRILDFLSKDCIEINLKSKNKKEVIAELVEILKGKDQKIV